jgi:DNA-3-methyladenine glycosylase I
MTTTPDKPRCPWVGTDPLMIAYHDDEWGIPCHDDHALFERLMLECFQAGLSWSTILRKRQNFRHAFHGWDAHRIATYGPADIERLLNDPSIVRNRLKIAAAVRNAQAFLAIQHDHGSFDHFLWSFVGGAPLLKPTAASLSALTARTPESDALSKALKQRGFTFVGSTICYALMQSVGMVNDHVQGCWKTESPSPD